MMKRIALVALVAVEKEEEAKAMVDADVAVAGLPVLQARCNQPHGVPNHSTCVVLVPYHHH